jgi:hypothetical protein
LKSPFTVAFTARTVLQRAFNKSLWKLNPSATLHQLDPTTAKDTRWSARTRWTGRLPSTLKQWSSVQPRPLSRWPRNRLQLPAPESQRSPAVCFHHSTKAMFTDSKAEDSPLGRNKSAHTQLKGAKLGPQQVTVGDLFAMGVPMDILAKTLSGK